VTARTVPFCGMTATHTQHIEPTDRQVETLVAAAEQDHGPVVMVNLLAFNNDGGRAGYERYAKEVAPHLDRVGAEILYAGDAAQVVIGGTDAPWWETVVVVRYPSRAKFLEMALDPGYQEIAVHRSAALQTSGLIATDPWEL
jgi:uncharacterized protein (DUF1330 family)